ncbi:hypothetical protein LTR09_000308 [Extremus antarcticus]|uniref:Uncharacterized protein n=1 Tax=Extremus antarcticus TaxID=702011 RepID=A0AAJ0GJI8_9PEZI|nr:hypothetical protein LTR09_000308 [Extremus antarcticus]
MALLPISFRVFPNTTTTFHGGTGLRMLEYVNNEGTGIGFGEHFLPFFEHGCAINGQYDCTAACTRPNWTWSDLPTICNCLNYSIISQLLDSGWLDEAASRIAESYSIYSRHDVNLSSIIEPINSCASEVQNSVQYPHTHDPQYYKTAYLMAQQLMNVTDPRTFLEDSVNRRYTVALSTGPFANTPQGSAVSVLLNDFNIMCESVAGSESYSDIGGVGVYASYLMQVAVVLAAWIYGNVLLAYIRRAATKIASSTQGYDHELTTLREKQARAKLQCSALIHGLVEYQKAQCYFTITLQAASMLALNGNGAIFRALSYTQIDQAVDLLGDVAATA